MRLQPLLFAFIMVFVFHVTGQTLLTEWYVKAIPEAYGIGEKIRCWAQEKYDTVERFEYRQEGYLSRLMAIANHPNSTGEMKEWIENGGYAEYKKRQLESEQRANKVTACGTNGSVIIIPMYPILFWLSFWVTIKHKEE